MAVLSRNDILERIKEGKLKFTPNLDAFQMQPHAVDLRLGLRFRLARHWKVTDKGREATIVDPFTDLNTQHEIIDLKPGQYFELLPGEMVIGETYEQIGLTSEDIMAVLYPRSSLNRRGLSIDLSGIVDVWYEGALMIPISNKTDQVIRVYPGERICQVTFSTLSSGISKEEGEIHGVAKAKYQGGNGVEARKDRNEEIDLIKSGQLDSLKQNYSL